MLNIFRTPSYKNTSGGILLVLLKAPSWLVYLSFFLTCRISCFKVQFCVKITKKQNKHGLQRNCRSSRPEVFLKKGVLKICSKFLGEHPYRSIVSINFICNFIEIALRHGYSLANLLDIFRITFPKNTSRRLFLKLFDVDKVFK